MFSHLCARSYVSFYKPSSSKWRLKQWKLFFEKEQENNVMAMGEFERPSTTYANV